MSVGIRLLGQAGVRLQLGTTVVYVDPYLTEHVYEVERQADLRRLVPIAIPPEEVTDADYVCATHVHLDHCDPTTIAPVLKASPGAKVICPRVCRSVLVEAGVPEARILDAPEGGTALGSAVSLHAVPAAHPEIVRDDDGHLQHVGYVFGFEGRRYYHAGDTSVAAELIAAVQALGPVFAAFLPVNERNYYREARGIIGNMSVRDAFRLAEDLQVRHLIPVHWDMFAPNTVLPEEIELLYRRLKPPFELHFDPGSL